MYFKINKIKYNSLAFVFFRKRIILTLISLAQSGTGLSIIFKKVLKAELVEEWFSLLKVLRY